MVSEMKQVDTVYKTRTYRWLFYMSVFSIVFFLIFPILVFPIPFNIIIYLEIVAALTVGVLFALYFLGVNIYGIFADKHRKRLYVVLIILMSAWIIWAIISWKYIQYMDYLLKGFI